jgi:putative ABC transport system permease protein
MTGLGHDLSLALRQIGRRPGLALLVVLTLGSAIGVNTGLFAVFNTVVFHGFPVADPERVVHVQNRTPGRPIGTSIAEWRYLSRAATSFRTLAAMPWGRSVVVEGREIRLQYVSANFFTLLGTPMVRGRGFLPDDEAPGSTGNVAVLSRPLWISVFGGAPDVFGRTIVLDGVSFTIVGVTDFTGFSLRPTQVWVPLTAQAFWEPDGGRDFLTSAERCCAEIVGRLADGVPPERARAEVEGLSARFRAPLGRLTERFETRPVGASMSRASRLLTRTGFGLLFAAVSLVLPLACANVGNLLLARATERRGEMSIRMALGARRRRLVRQLLVESLALAIIAGLTGIGLSRVLPGLVLRSIPDAAGWTFPADHRILLYTLGLSMFACVAAGLAPALHGTRTAAGLPRPETPGTSALRLRLRGVLMASQVALSLVLLVGAGLFVRGLRHALTRDLGFTAEGVSVVSFETPFRSTDAAAVGAFVDDLEAVVESLGGPDRVALSPTLPMEAARGRARRPEEDAQHARWVSSLVVSWRTFELLRVPLRAGRPFSPDDRPDRVVVVNETLAVRLWPGQSAVGRSLVWRGTTRQVVGIVRDAHLTDFEDVDPTVFSLAEAPVLPYVLVRDPGLAQAVLAAATRIEPRVRPTLAPLTSRFDRALRTSRLGAWVAGGVGALALALSTLGLFGFCAYSVQQQTREIGVRIALGARTRHVLASVFQPVSGALLTGLAVGVLGALGASCVLRHLTFGLGGFDPVTYAGVAALLLTAAVIATYLPVRRALRIDPAAALRHE